MRLTILILALMSATPGFFQAPTTCSTAIQNCISAATGKVVDVGCKQAGAACMQNGTFVGPRDRQGVERPHKEMNGADVVHRCGTASSISCLQN